LLIEKEKEEAVEVSVTKITVVSQPKVEDLPSAGEEVFPSHHTSTL